MVEGEDYELLAWTDGMLSYHLDGNGKEMNPNRKFKEAEIVYYPKTKALAIQGHPEIMNPVVHKETFEYLNGLINKYIR